MIYFTADTHYNHSNILKYCNRPFKDVNEMNEVMIINWNAVVRDVDIVYHLGDFGMGSVERLKLIFNRLNGRKILIIGSHDKTGVKLPWEIKMDRLTIDVESISITLSHYAMRSWSKSFYGSWHLFGHSHGRLEPLGKSFDVGVDTHNFLPWSLGEIKEKMSFLCDNKD